MSSTRYKIQRYKFQKYQTGIIDIKLWRYAGGESENFCQKKVQVVSGGHCNGVGKYVYIKYLASDGKYKFIPFNRSTTLEQNDEQIGSVSTIITSLSGPNTGSASMGYTTHKKMQLTTPVTKDQYVVYSEVLSSPRVYLQKDTDELNDEDENWILVNLEGGSTYNVNKPQEIFSITITLPEYNNLKM